MNDKKLILEIMHVNELPPTIQDGPFVWHIFELIKK